jgi:CheY-like chemotaxis protein
MRAMPKILVVEDNELNRDMLSRRLERRGYQVIVAVDGQEGVAMARSEAPDLVLMDMSLPVMDGWESTRQLKAAPETQSIPVIALTAHAMAADREKALEAGCDDYDTKPLEFPRLMAKIEALLLKARPRQIEGLRDLSETKTRAPINRESPSLSERKRTE